MRTCKDCRHFEMGYCSLLRMLDVFDACDRFAATRIRGDSIVVRLRAAVNDRRDPHAPMWISASDLRRLLMLASSAIESEGGA